MLNSRFDIIGTENRLWNKEEVFGISDVCAIFENIIISMVEMGEIKGS